jgi:hypothetical protein
MKTFTVVLFLLLPFSSFSQFAASYNLSSLPYAGFSYEFNERIKPELRIDSNDFFESIAGELIATYDFINKEEFEFYGGLGGRYDNFGGVVLPIGLNLYPIQNKNFGFQLELTPIIGESALLRGSLGIRYRFGKSGVD